MSGKKASGAGAGVDEWRDDLAGTRDDRGDPGSGSADGKSRVKEVATQGVTKARDGAQEAAEQVGGSVRRRPGRWASAAGATMVAAAATTAGVLRWRRSRRTPRSRMTRAWRSMTRRFGR